MVPVSEKDLMPIKIELAIRYYEYFNFNFYVKKDEKNFIEVVYKSIGLKNTFTAYKDRGLTEIHLKSDDFNTVVTKLKLILMQTKKYKEAFLDIDNICYNVGQNFINFGISPLTSSRHKETNMAVIQSIVAFPDLAEKVVNFKNEAPRLFYLYLLKSYLAMSILEQLDWRSDILKSKIAQACLFMDINLTDEDLKLMQNKSREDWPQHVINHPVLNANLLKETSDKFSSEVLQMIEFHHEFPDGEGFPKKIESRTIPMIACIVIVAEVFANKIEEVDFDAKNKTKWTNYLNDNFSRGSFRSIKDALITSLNKKN